MKKLFFFLLSFLCINSLFSQVNFESMSRYQPSMPCGTLNTSLKWNDGIEDLKDILIMQLLIQEDRYTDLQSFLDDQGYTEVEDNIYIKDFRTSKELNLIVPIITIQDNGKSRFGEDKNDIYLSVMLGYGTGEVFPEYEVNQPTHNAIFIGISAIMNKGFIWNLFNQRIQLYQDENKGNIANGLPPRWDGEYIDKYKYKVTNRETGEVQEFEASNTLGIGNDFKSQFLTYFFEDDRKIWIEIIANDTTQGEGDTCMNNIVLSTLRVSTDALEIKKPLDVKLFKSLSNLNEIIWSEED